MLYDKAVELHSYYTAQIEECESNENVCKDLTVDNSMVISAYYDYLYEVGDFARKSWSEFNVPMMLVGLVVFGIINAYEFRALYGHCFAYLWRSVDVSDFFVVRERLCVKYRVEQISFLFLLFCGYMLHGGSSFSNSFIMTVRLFFVSIDVFSCFIYIYSVYCAIYRNLPFC